MILLIFDFDGTIVDSKTVYYHAIEKHLKKAGFSKGEIDAAIDKGLSIKETLKKLGLSNIINWWTKRKILADVLIKVREIKKCRDVNSIRSLKAKKILISNSFDEFIIPILKHLKIRDEFSEIYGADEFNNKQKFIQEYIKKNKLNKKEIYYIGDRVADVKLARNLGIGSIAISNKCSWDSRSSVLKQKPDFMLFDLRDIKDII